MKLAKSTAATMMQSALRPGHRMSTALWPVVLAFAFLFAQSASYQHSYVHAGLYQSQATALSDAAKSKPARGNFLCFFHDALTTVVAAAAGKSPSLAPSHATSCKLTGWQFAVRVAQAPTPGSRGPPLLALG